MKKIIYPILGLVLVFQTGCLSESITQSDSHGLVQGDSRPADSCSDCAIDPDTPAETEDNSDGSGDLADSGSNPEGGDDTPVVQNPPAEGGPGNSDKGKNNPGDNAAANPGGGNNPANDNAGDESEDPGGVATACKNNKVLVCHNVNNNPHNICVAQAAVPAHLDHQGSADYLGVCQ